jgi:hypothetical protein
MDSKFHIYIFKNNKKKKKLKSFVRENLAQNYYKNLLQKSNEIVFDKKFESGKECKFHIAILSDKFVYGNIHYTDEFGRNITISPKIDEHTFIQTISTYKLPEQIFDVQNDERIVLDDFFKKYIKKDKIYMISQLKNKFILQNDDDYKLFSLKNVDDCDRLLDVFTNFKERASMIIVKDMSTIHRKYLYNLLIEKGFDKKFLYTSFTTYPR